MNILALDPGYMTGLLYVHWKNEGLYLLEHGFFKEKELFFLLDHLFDVNPPDYVLVERTKGHALEGKVIRYLEKKKTLLYTVSPSLVQEKLFGTRLPNRDRKGQEKRMAIASQYGWNSLFSIHELDALLLIHFYLQEASRRQEDVEDPMWFYDVLRNDKG